MEKFNFEYLVVVPKNKAMIAEAIIGRDLTRKSMERASGKAREWLRKISEDILSL